MSLFAELQRRNVLRVAIAYAVAGWLLVEVVEIITGAFDAPPWVLKTFMSLLALGIVPAMVLAWIYELTPEGIRKEAPAATQTADSVARKLDLAVLAMLAIAVAIYLFGQPAADPPTATRQPTAVAETEPAGPTMVAVLPFAASGQDGDSQFFADGIHDDLLTQLAKLQSLRVISRTAVMEYRGTTKKIPEIGRELGASSILEGSMQAAGDRIRVNAQLIDAGTDQHLWAETYDRELSTADIFDIQAEIARSISRALKATLSDQEESDLGGIPTGNMAAYREFHRAMELRSSNFWRRDQLMIRAALERAVELDPDFTRAWAELVGVYTYMNLNGRQPELEPLAQQAVERVYALAPESAEYRIAQAYYLYYSLKDYAQALVAVDQALEKKPSDVRALALKTWILRRSGDYEARIGILHRTRELDPRNPEWTRHLVIDSFLLHRYEDAAREGRAIEAGIDYRLDLFVAWLRAQANNDPRALRDDVERLGALHTHFDWPGDLWNARVLARDPRLLEAVDLIRAETEEPSHRLGFHEAVELLSMRYLDRGAELAAALERAQLKLDAQRDERGNYPPDVLLDAALVAALTGDADTTERYLLGWNLVNRGNATNLYYEWDHVCVVYALAGLTDQAIGCLRTGLQQPSFVSPLLVRHHPAFDPLRDLPAFQSLLAE